MTRFVGFIGPSYTLQLPVDCQRCCNLYPQFDEMQTGKAGEVASLAGTPGLRLLSSVGTGPIRGLYLASTGVLYVVSGSTLYSVSSAWSATSLGSLLSSTGPVSMVDNGISLCVVDGPNGYVLTLATSAWNTITDPDFLGADKVGFIDGFFVFNDPGTGKFYISSLYGTDFDALDFATAEGSPDDIVSLIVDHREVWLFGTQTTEVWFNSGGADFPFSRIQGAFIEHGCGAKHSVCKLNNSVFWLGADDKGAGVIFMAEGYQPRRISTHAVEMALQSYGDLSESTAYTYQQDGHAFYVFQAPNAATTWVFDVATGLWHERFAFVNGVELRHRGACHAFFNLTAVVGDYLNGNLYAFDLATYSDNGAVLRRLRRSPHLTRAMKNVFYAAVELDFEAGTGLDGTGQGSDPQLMMRFSKDGARTWSNERTLSSGQLGQYRRRAIFRRLGVARDMVIEMAMSDPVKTTWIGAEIDAQEGMS